MNPSKVTIASDQLNSAIERYRIAKKTLHNTMRIADQDKVGRNEIARRLYGIYSRQTVFNILNREDEPS